MLIVYVNRRWLAIVLIGDAVELDGRAGLGRDGRHQARHYQVFLLNSHRLKEQLS